MKKLILAVLALVCAATAFAQKPSLDHSVYDNWKSVASLQVPYNGDWLLYNINPQEGDASLVIQNLRNNKTYTVPRASGAVVNADATKVVFRIAPFFQQTRQARIEKKRADQIPKDTLAILDLASGKIEKIPFLSDF
ncbi:MAG: hypothetical protein J6Z27_03525, partial [Bacteroidales bacterium]|nr:hypothetical protein [Bacteroidales bacterium]